MSTPDLPAVAGARKPDGDDAILIRGLESITAGIMRGFGVPGSAIDSYRKIIARAKALEAALERRGIPKENE